MALSNSLLMKVARVQPEETVCDIHRLHRAMARTRAAIVAKPSTAHAYPRWEQFRDIEAPSVRHQTIDRGEVYRLGAEVTMPRHSPKPIGA